MKQLQTKLEKYAESEKIFYEDAIKLHNDLRLRQLADKPIQIYDYRKDQNSFNNLYYAEKGFYVETFRFTNFVGNTHELHQCSIYCREENGKLFALVDEQKQPLLDAFPKLTLKAIEKKLTEEIQKRLKRDVKKIDLEKIVGKK